MAYVYTNLENPQNTTSGVGEYCLIAPVRWFATNGIKKPAAGGVLVSDNHVFALSEYGFAKYMLAPEKNQLEASTVGEKGSYKLSQELTIFLPGSYQEAHESVMYLLNEPLIVLQRDADCETNFYYQLGGPCRYASLKADFKTGTTVEGVKGYLCTISFVNSAIWLYSGTVQMVGVIIGGSMVDFAESDFDSADFA